MTREQFRENILKHADHDFEECQRIFAESNICLWCEGEGTVSENSREGEHGVETVACPICSMNKKHE